MTIKDIISKTPFRLVLDVLEKHHENVPVGYLDTFYSNLNQFSGMSPSTMSVIIRAYLPDDGDGDEKLLEVFDKNDSRLVFDVSAVKPDEDIAYSIAGMEISDFLSLQIDESMPACLNSAEILAHCIWELTAYNDIGQSGQSGTDPNCQLPDTVSDDS